MKKLIWTFLLCFGSLAFANGDKYTFRLDWDHVKPEGESVVLLCDDAQYSAAEVVIPGKPSEDFVVEIVADITSGHPVLGCDFQQKVNEKTTVYTFVPTQGSCEIQVHKVRKNWTEKPQTASYEIHDAC